MLKTISAALLAISVLAAPAMAAGIAKDTVKTTPVSKTAQVPVINAVKVKPSVLNANAKMGRYHHGHHRFHKHLSYKHLGHKHIGANKPHQFSKVTVKHVKTAIKRG
jgi:opacity protein-like surface antigen